MEGFAPGPPKSSLSPVTPVRANSSASRGVRQKQSIGWTEMTFELDGYTGKILEVDLTEGKVSETPLDIDLATKYLGGKGFAARYLYDHLPKGSDPFSPENLLVFATGPLTGTLFPGSGRSIVSTKSPATGLWLDANCGGSFGPELKMAGYDALVIRGRLLDPYLFQSMEERRPLEKLKTCGGKTPFRPTSRSESVTGRNSGWPALERQERRCPALPISSPRQGPLEEVGPGP